MANPAIENQGKTKFVENYLATHGNTRRPEIVAAWQAAGHADEISESLVSKLRAKSGFTSSQGEPAEADDGYATEHDSEVGQPVVRRRGRPRNDDIRSTLSDESKTGKSSFVADFLIEHPDAKVRDIKRAWTAAGNDDTISGPTYYKVKARIAAEGSTGAGLFRRGEGMGTSRTDSQPTSSRSQSSASVASSHSPGNRKVVDEVEAGIDDLMFRLKTSGGMPEVEATLRAARRQLYSDGKG